MTTISTDATTLALASVIVVVLVVRWKLRPPPPQLHPLLLGRQCLSTPTRLEHESPVYTTSNQSSTSVLRPDKAVRSLDDVLRGSLTCLECGQRGAWVKGGEKLVDLVAAVRAGLVSKLGKGTGKVLVSVHDPTDALLVTLALATSSHKPLVVSPGSELPNDEDVTAVVHSATNALSASAFATGPNATFIALGGEGDSTADDILATGKALVAAGEAEEVAKAEPTDVALTFFCDGVALDIPHVSLTSSLVSWLALFPGAPTSTKPTIKDTIYTFHHPSTPYGLGLALLAASTSASLLFPSLSSRAPSPEEVEVIFTTRTAPPATLLFASAEILATPLYTLTLQKMLGDSSFIIRHARDGKVRLLREGSVSKQTFWDSLLFQSVRKDLALHKVRAVVLSGSTEQNKLELFRCALGCPAASTLEHPFLLSPLSHGHLYDYQRLAPPGLATSLNGKEQAHVGAPAVGVELKLRGDEGEIADGRMRGEVLLRSPVLPRPTTLPQSVVHTDESRPALPPIPGTKQSSAEPVSQWFRTGVQAELAPEGVLFLV
ncbi:hypothetical protein JCM10212_000846 [Sporobolomyces blumeae]